MKVRLLKIVQAGVFLMALVVLAVTPVVEAQSQNSLAKAKDKQPVEVRLAHPISVREALTTLKNSNDPEIEIRIVADKVIAGFRPNKTRSVESQARWVEGYFKRQYDAQPAVVAVSVDSTKSANVKSLKTKLDEAQKVSIGKTVKPTMKQPEKKKQTSSQLSAMAAQDIPEYYPTTIWGSAYNTSDNMRDYVYWFNYYDESWGYKGNPSAFPSDWGMELGFTSYNTNITGISRPFCGLGGNTNFWSSTYAEGFIWSTYNVPEEAAPYADYNIESDSCKDNSVEVGIGYPQNLPVNTDMYALVELQPGEQNSSPAAATASMVSNDCNDIGVWPGTNCMGLNVLRDFPAGYKNAQPYVNRSRNWTIPGCMWMQDQMEAPMLDC